MAKVHKNYSSDKEKGNESVLSARLFAYRTGDTPEVNPQNGKIALSHENIPPKGVIFSDFICTFAMPLKFLLVLKCTTKLSEIFDMTGVLKS